jgi:hypothetical protein
MFAHHQRCIEDIKKDSQSAQTACKEVQEAREIPSQVEPMETPYSTEEKHQIAN